ncbi:MAG TPA: ATP-binding protein [Solirubrobacteraceae bacterium]|jgi:anti-sigma regulatory factor (Ser/Thr protein kinase)|nr:ATP-binding protein [Solirubrobacteraceae bacterium]
MCVRAETLRRDRQTPATFERSTGRESETQTFALIEDSPAVRLELSSWPESVTLVRSVLAALGEALALDPELLDDLKTAISEACNNVVLHAYPGTVGPMFVELAVSRTRVEVTVEDFGGGIKHLSHSDDRMGVGLAVISALAERAEFLSEADAGTTVRMSFAGGSAEISESAPSGVGATPTAAEVKLSGDVVATVTPVELLARVLGRAARATAARAHFTVDRFADLTLITNALGDCAVESHDGQPVGFSILSAPRRLELAIGPLRNGSGAELSDSAAAGEPAATLGRLVDELRVEPDGAHELLRVVFADRSRDRD